MELASVFLRGQESGHAAIGFGDDPDPITSGEDVGAEDPHPLPEREFIRIPIKCMEIPPISMCMTDEELEGVKLRGGQRRNRAGSGDNLSEGKPCGGVIMFLFLLCPSQIEGPTGAGARARDSYRAWAHTRQVLCQLLFALSPLPFQAAARAWTFCETASRAEPLLLPLRCPGWAHRVFREDFSAPNSSDTPLKAHNGRHESFLVEAPGSFSAGSSLNAIVCVRCVRQLALFSAAFAWLGSSRASSSL